MTSSLKILITLLLMLVITGCPQAAAWRDSQIKQSHDLAQDERIIPPEKRIEIPKAVMTALPLHDSFEVIQYTKGPNDIAVTVLSAWDPTTTIQWVTAWLTEHGYSSDDNISRILEGVTYRNGEAKYSSIYIKVDMNTAEQCTIELTATR